MALLLSTTILHPSSAIAAEAKDPPLVSRQALRARGNLIPDSSFESGAQGWRLEQAAVTRENPFVGARAVVLKAHAGERAIAEVEVPAIPGEYALSAALRLSGIYPAAGERVSDRFRVSITWLDARGAPIVVPPVSAFGRTLRAGERSFPLFFLREADRIPWRRATFLASYVDPSGNEAPEGTSRARIRFVLEGPGEAGLDDCRFAYGRHNFSLAERIAPYRSLNDDALGRVIPSPKLIEERGGILSIRTLCLRTSRIPPAGLAERLRVFDARLQTFGARLAQAKPRGKTTCDAALALPDPNRKSSAEAADLLRRARALGPEAYVIETRTDPQGRPVFIAAGADAAGTVYAVETLRQLLRPSGLGQAGLRAVTVRDWPTFHGRPISEGSPDRPGIRHAVQASHWMAGVKLNRLYLNYPLMTPRWWEAPAPYQKLVEVLGRRAQRTGLYRLGVLLNPYFQRADATINDTFQISLKEDRGILWARIRDALDRGARVIVLCLDDYTPSYGRDRLEYALTDPADRDRFGTLARAHAALVRDLHGRIRRYAPGVTLLFVPPWYNEAFREMGGGVAEDYLQDVGRMFPRDVGLVWTGPSVRSLTVDEVALHRFARSIGARPIVLWDNTLYALELNPHFAMSPRRAVRASWLAPFEGKGEALAASSFGGEVYVNGSSGGRYVLKAMTVADFLWNPEAYDPDRSLWRAMVARLGRKGAERLLAWDAASWEARGELARAASAGDRSPPADRARFAQARAQARARWAELAEVLRGRDDELLEDLSTLAHKEEARWEKIGKRSPRGLTAQGPKR